MPCCLCPNPALCNPVCRAFEFAPAAVRDQLREDCAKSGQMTAEEVASHVVANEMPNVYDEEWVCEAHPDKPFLHDGCPGPGMLSDESCARLEQVAAHVEAGEMPVPRMSRESRAMLLNVLWHHQGGSSPVGQPLRKLLGIGQHNHLTAEQLIEATWIDGLLARATIGGEAGEMEAAKGDRK